MLSLRQLWFPFRRIRPDQVAVLAIIFTILPAWAESEWPGFLGAGRAPVPSQSIDSTPLKFDQDGTNVLWKVPSGKGHSSPCISGQYLFLTSTEESGRILIMTAYDRATGKILWKETVSGEVEDGYGHLAADPAQPTACTDGERVYFFFGGYGLIARDIEKGALVWEKNFEFEARMFGTGSSPVLHENSLYLVRDGGDNSALWCFDKRNGSLLWKSPRPGLRHGYTSPFVWKNRDRTEIVVPGTNTLMAYDPEDGHLLWSVEDLCRFPCTTPTGDKDHLYFAAWATPNAESDERNEQNFWGDLDLSEKEASDIDYIFERFDQNGDDQVSREELPDSRARDAFRFFDRNKDGFWSAKEVAGLNTPKAPGQNLMVAVEAGHDGLLTKGSGIAWTYDVTKALPYVPSPLLLNDRIHLVKSGGVVTSLDAKTGTPLYGPKRSGVSGEYYASPVAWGDQVILSSHRGIVLSLSGEDTFEVLAENEVGEAIYATPAVVDGVLYLRSAEHLWAIGM
ncbi:MAG: PQQ-binding-like beta-propeller repeat protein [Verrucomicrobiota bacterium]